MTIRQAQPTDLDAIQGLLDACELPHHDLTSAHLDHFLVARDEERLHGVVGLEPCGDVALLRSLAVVPDGRDEGLGTRLVETVEQVATDDGIRTLYLLTTTAAKYFQAHGYEQLDRAALPEAIRQTEEATRLCPASAVCMRKALHGTEQQA